MGIRRASIKIMRNWFSSSQEQWIVGGLVVVSLLLHLVGLQFPGQVVFDEVHFGKFVSAYCCTHQHVFDIHPPHAKLLVAGIVGLTSYDGSFSFEHIGQPYGKVPIVAFRLLPALIGTLIPLLIYILLRQAGVSVWLALMGGVAALLDNALLVQTRIIALDGLLVLTTFGALSAYIAARRAQDSTRYWWLALVGVLCGLAAGTKFTGLAILLLIGLAMVIRFVRRPAGRAFTQLLQEGLLVLAMAAASYIIPWYIHYAVVTEPGPGDAWQTPTGNFWVDVVDIHKKMLSANYNLSATHPYSSAWWTWPLMGRPVFYWQAGENAIYFIGNPLVWWGAFVMFVVFLGYAIGHLIGRIPLRGMSGVWWLFIGGYFISFAPLMRVPRALFLYHYLTPLLFSLLVSIVFLDQQISDEVRRRRVAVGVGLAIVIFFILFSPLTFGFSLSPAWRASLHWFPGWR